ncbi:A-kinase anchor protein 13-like [Tautogolabrus adspersus]
MEFKIRVCVYREKDEDEGVPSETEEDRRQQESRAKEIRELLRQKDEQIVSLLEEKVHIFRDLGDCSPAPDDRTPPVRERMLFRATADDVTKGEPIIKHALREVETLSVLVTSGVGGAGCSTAAGLTGGSVGPVCLPRRAETFGGFDSHQMNSSKNGEKEEGDESLDLRRTESDSVLKKGATASLQMLLKRNIEVQHSVTYLHDLLLSLQAVVVQDSFIEDQRQALSDRLTANSSRHSSSSSLSSSSSSRPSSSSSRRNTGVWRGSDRRRPAAAETAGCSPGRERRREKAWELKERGLAEQEEMLKVQEEETSRRRQELAEDRETLQKKKEEYQRELERLREAQRRLERDKEALRRDTEGWRP